MRYLGGLARSSRARTLPRVALQRVPAAPVVRRSVARLHFRRERAGGALRPRVTGRRPALAGLGGRGDVRRVGARRAASLLSRAGKRQRVCEHMGCRYRNLAGVPRNPPTAVVSRLRLPVRVRHHTRREAVRHGAGGHDTSATTTPSGTELVQGPNAIADRGHRLGGASRGTSTLGVARVDRNLLLMWALKDEHYGALASHPDMWSVKGVIDGSEDDDPCVYHAPSSQAA